VQTFFGTIAPVECSEILSRGIYKEIDTANPDIITRYQRLALFNSRQKTWKHILDISQVRVAIAHAPVV